jgi:multiple sugar transport system substrate-binding protein
MGKLRRSRVAAALVTVVCLVLAGCGGSGAGSGKTKITFWDDNGGPRTPVWQHIIDEFKKANPDIDVEYVGIPIAQVQQKYDTAIAGGGLPDVGGVSTAMLANLVAQKQVVGTVRETVPDKKLYFMPMSTNMGMYWYRTDWFTDAGLKAPQTWDEFFSDVQKLTDTGKNRYGFTIRGGSGSIAQMLEFIYGQSGVTEIFDGSGKATVNDPKNVAALEKLASLYKKYTPQADLTNDFPKMVAQFDGGTIAVMQHNLGSYNDHVKALGKTKVAAFAVPKSDNGTRTVVSNPVSGIGVFGTGKHKDAALRFAQFAAGKAMNSYWAEQTGQLPANSDVAGEAWLSGQQHIAEATKVLNDPGTKVVQLPYYLPEFNSITKTDTEPLFQKVLLGQLSARDFLDQFAGKLTDAQAKFKQRNGK